MKRRALLEKKIGQELEKAKEYTKAQNKRGACMGRPAGPMCQIACSCAWRAVIISKGKGAPG